jgi:hypothetical protein
VVAHLNETSRSSQATDVPRQTLDGQNLPAYQRVALRHLLPWIRLSDPEAAGCDVCVPPQHTSAMSWVNAAAWPGTTCARMGDRD